jgi:hypothetical protein
MKFGLEERKGFSKFFYFFFKIEKLAKQTIVESESRVSLEEEGKFLAPPLPLVSGWKAE